MSRPRHGQMTACMLLLVVDTKLSQRTATPVSWIATVQRFPDLFVPRRMTALKF